MFQGGDKCFRDCRNKKKYRISIPILKLKHYIHVLNKHTHIPGGTAREGEIKTYCCW